MYPAPDAYDVSVRDRVYGEATRFSEGRRSFVLVLLTICVFVFIVSLSCRQATAAGPARNVLESGIVTLTDLDQLITDEGPALRKLAAESEDGQVVIPGYPLDVVLTRAEVAESTDAELRTLILERSSALLYARGLGAFDRTGDQSIRRFSIQGILEVGVSQVSQSTHDRASLFAMISLLGCALCGAIVVASGSGWGRMRSLGLAAAAGAIPVAIMFFFLRLLVAQIGDDDPFVGGYRDITRAVLSVPLRNSMIVLVMGLAIVAASVILSRAERMTSGPQAHPIDDDY